ncbi:MAG: ComF family protein [Opitutales bacterium]|nr:ComF family protein [Opitutales bacterium]
MSFFKKFLDLIFPRHCAVCGKENPEDGFDYLCADCANEAYITQVPRCKRCAEIAPVSARGCAKCDGEELFFDSAMVACEYAQAGRELVLELKYRGGTYVAKDIARLASRAENFSEFFEGAILVPAPLHSSRLRKRGYNQSEEICKSLAKMRARLNLKVENLLARRRPTPTQTALSKKDRILNVRGAFEVSKKLKDKIDKNAKIVVVDDVMTSGATLNECAKTLKKCGFKNVRAFAFARRS